MAGGVRACGRAMRIWRAACVQQGTRLWLGAFEWPPRALYGSTIFLSPSSTSLSPPSSASPKTPAILGKPKGGPPIRGRAAGREPPVATPKLGHQSEGRAAGRAQSSGSCWGWGGALRSTGRERGLQEGTAAAG
eukprot:559384-Prymnesium_polylepis.1